MISLCMESLDPQRDFGQLAEYFTILEGWKNTPEKLEEFYRREKKRVHAGLIREDPKGVLGFYWAERDKTTHGLFTFYLFVEPGHRRQGIGRYLYTAMMQVLEEESAERLHTSIWDTCAEGMQFLKRRAFVEKLHRIEMELNLDTFDDTVYDGLIVRLKEEGFQFISMQELGNTEEAQRKLYDLNTATAMDIPGWEGSQPWESFEDFQQSVCQQDWYIPSGQMLAIDTHTGAWAAMSAITRMEGVEYAYNLHTGVAKGYRGRKLAQAIKVIALRYAREVLKVHSVHTHHNLLNLPILAIDRKFGYTELPGTVLMEKKLTLNTETI